jgi:hypothetical protein
MKSNVSLKIGPFDELITLISDDGLDTAFGVILVRKV